jgi:hypothetical protein
MRDFETKYQTVHKRLSVVKSAIRIGACIVVLFVPLGSLEANVAVLAIGLLAAEILGIAEEMI